jgi:hypothetical protein
MRGSTGLSREAIEEVHCMSNKKFNITVSRIIGFMMLLNTSTTVMATF